VLVATVLASVISYIDESVVNIALPAIAKDLAVQVAAIQWVINAYTLSLSSFLLIGGAAGDQFGRRRIFIVGVAIFAVASVCCGLASNIGLLIGARAVQGIGAALLIPCSLAIIGASFPEAERGRAIGTWAGFSAIAAAIGPLLGGWIVDYLTWQAIFLINPFPRDTRDLTPSAFTRELRSHSPTQASTGLARCLFWEVWVAYSTHCLPDAGKNISVAAPLVLGFFYCCLHLARTPSPAPLIPLDLFRSRTFSGINALTLLLYAALGGAFFLLPFDLIQVHGYSATLAGTVFLPFTIIMGVLSRWSGGLLDRVGARLPLILGPTIVAAGFALFAASGVTSSYWVAFLLPIVVVGFGMAITVAPLTTTVINAVPRNQAGVASGINNAIASVASLLAIAIFGAVTLSSFNAP
jgi:MFS family permease